MIRASMNHRRMSLSESRPRNFLLWNSVVFFMVVGVDQLLKSWAVSLDVPLTWGIFTILPVGNTGIFGGYFADLDPWILRIFFSVLFGFLCLAAILLVHLFKHKQIPLMRTGLALYLAGILGNVWDRISTGMVVDYFLVGVGTDMTMAFNFADAVVGVGFVYIVRSIFREADALWHPQRIRRGYWVNSFFQKNFGMFLMMIGFSHFLVIALYSYAFLKVFVTGYAGSTMTSEQIIRDYLLGLGILEGVGLLLTFGVSILFSHRLVGPLIALDLHLEKKVSGDLPLPELRLRKGDYLREIVESMGAKINALKKD